MVLSESGRARRQIPPPGPGTIRRGWSGPYIVDFVCFPAKLIIEHDGPQHLTPEALEYDGRRTNWLVYQGFHVIRFRNQELDDNIHGVIDTIARALKASEPPKSPPSPALPTEGRESNQEPVALPRKRGRAR